MHRRAAGGTFMYLVCTVSSFIVYVNVNLAQNRRCHQSHKLQGGGEVWMGRRRLFVAGADGPTLAS